MSLVHWKDMSSAQRVEAIKLRPTWHMSDFPNFEFWIKADGHVSRRGGHHRLTLARGDYLTTRYWPVIWREPVYWPRLAFTDCACGVRGREG